MVIYEQPFIQNGTRGIHTGSLLGSIPSDRSRQLVFFADGAVLETLSVTLGLGLLVLGVTLSTAFLARGLQALDAGNVTDRLLNLAHGALHGAGSLAA